MGIVARMRIGFIGDSFVNGTGDVACLGWAGRVCAQARQSGIDLTYYNLGIRRDTSADIAARWQDEVTARLPADIDGRLVFSYGVNDCVTEDGRRRQTLAETLANSRNLLARAQGWRPTLFVGPPPIADPATNARIEELSMALEALCADLRIPYLDTFPTLSASPIWMREVAHGDGAHPDEPGYRVLANLVRDWPAWQDWIAAALRG